MNPYLQMDVNTTSPEELVGRLLDRAVALIDTSIARQPTHPVESAQASAKALDIVSELRGALDAEAGGEVAANLDALYEFVNRKLVLGSAGSEPVALEEARRVLDTLASGWSELLAQRRESP